MKQKTAEEKRLWRSSGLEFFLFKKDSSLWSLQAISDISIPDLRTLFEVAGYSNVTQSRSRRLRYPSPAERAREAVE